MQSDQGNMQFSQLAFQDLVNSEQGYSNSSQLSTWQVNLEPHNV
jgi:hypothetical protein